jgi:hypothetical protein
VGFYTTVAGLGRSPDDVAFTGSKGVFTEEGSSNFTLGALENFWRWAALLAIPDPEPLFSQLCEEI